MFQAKTRPNFLLAPKIMTIVYVLLLVYLSLDSFKTKTPFSHQILIFLIYMFPVLILLLFLWISCKNTLIGGSLYIISSILMITFWDPFKEISGFLAAPLPLITIGFLFIVFGILDKKH